MSLDALNPAVSHAIRLLDTDGDVLIHIGVELLAGVPTKMKKEQLRRQLAGVIADLEVIKAGLA